MGEAIPGRYSGDLPPMPWRLRAEGMVLVTLHRVAVERARAFVPSEFRILQYWPGWTVGGLFLARYGPGSDLEYNELIASCATVLHRGRPAPWATHLFVDNPDSVAGGRALLGAPKHLAAFAREEGARSSLTVGDAGRPVCRLHFGRQLWLWRQRLRVAALHLDVRDSSCSTIAIHGNELHGRMGLTRARVEIPEASPLHPLRFGRPLLSLCARNVTLLLGGAPFLPLQHRPVTPPGSAA